MKTTASMRKRINSLLEELGEGWSEGDPFEGRNGHPTIPMAYQGKLVGNLAFPNYGTLRYIWGPCGRIPHLYQKPAKHIADMLRRAAGITPNQNTQETAGDSPSKAAV